MINQTLIPKRRMERSTGASDRAAEGDWVPFMILQKMHAAILPVMMTVSGAVVCAEDQVHLKLPIEVTYRST